MIAVTICSSSFECIDDSYPAISDHMIDTDHTAIFELSKCVESFLKNRTMFIIYKMALSRRFVKHEPGLGECDGMDVEIRVGFVWVGIVLTHIFIISSICLQLSATPIGLYFFASSAVLNPNP